MHFLVVILMLDMSWNLDKISWKSLKINKIKVFFYSYSGGNLRVIIKSAVVKELTTLLEV